VPVAVVTADPEHECLDCGHQWVPVEERPDDDWDTIDLREIAAKIRSGEYQPIIPTVLGVVGHLALFYRERINALFGESGGGKSWLAFAAVAEVVRSGERALVADYEDNPAGVAERLVLLGLTDDEIGRVDYRNPVTGIGKGLGLIEVEPVTYALIVIDSTGEAMAASATDSNSDGEVAQWFKLAKMMGRLPGGPAVLVLDHVPKDKEAPSAFAIGSQRKRAAVTGAAYRVDTLKEPSKGRNGLLKLTVAKDRPGNRPKGSTAAEVVITSTDGAVGIELRIGDAQAAVEAGEKFRPTVLMERVSRHLEAIGADSARGIERMVTGKGTAVRLAVKVLEEEGWIKAGAKGYEVVDEYRAPVDNHEARPASQARPSASRDAAEEARPPRPVYTKTRDAGRASEGGDEGQPTESASPVDNSPELF